MDCNQESRAVGICSTYPCKKFSTRIFRKELHIPRLDEVEDVWVLVYAAIVHHNYRIQGRKWLHLIQRTLDEFVECCGDEPPHQIRSYTLLFLLSLHFPYVADPPLCTSTPTRLHAITLALTLSDRSHLFDGHMTYDSHVFTSILSVSNVPPPVVRPITSSRTMQSGTFYNFALCSHSCLPFVFNLPVFTFHQRTSSPKP